MTQPLRWLRRKRDRITSPETIELARGKTVYVIAQRIQGDLWFYYRCNSHLPLKNTAHNPQPLDVVKREALAFVKQYLAENPTA